MYNGPKYVRKAVEVIQPFLKLGAVKRSGRRIRISYPITEGRSRKLRINGLFSRIKKVRAKNKISTLAQEVIDIKTRNGKSIRYKAYEQYKENLQQSKKNIRYR